MKIQEIKKDKVYLVNGRRYKFSTALNALLVMIRQSWYRSEATYNEVIRMDFQEEEND